MNVSKNTAAIKVKREVWRSFTRKKRSLFTTMVKMIMVQERWLNSSSTRTPSMRQRENSKSIRLIKNGKKARFTRAIMD